MKRRQFEFCATPEGTLVKVPKDKWRPCTWRTLSKEEVKKWKQFGRKK